MGDITYKVDYPDPSYIEEASDDSSANISGKGTIADPSVKLLFHSSGRHKCFEGPDLSLVVPWSNYVDWWYRCNRCGKIMYAYDCGDKGNDDALRFLMDKAGFKYENDKLLTYVEGFLKKVCG